MQWKVAKKTKMAEEQVTSCYLDRSRAPVMYKHWNMPRLLQQACTKHTSNENKGTCVEFGASYTKSPCDMREKSTFCVAPYFRPCDVAVPAISRYNFSIASPSVDRFGFTTPPDL